MLHRFPQKKHSLGTKGNTHPSLDVKSLKNLILVQNHKLFAIILIGHSLPRVCYVLVIIKLKNCGSLSIHLDRGFKILQDLIQDCIDMRLAARRTL